MTGRSVGMSGLTAETWVRLGWLVGRTGQGKGRAEKPWC